MRSPHKPGDPQKFRECYHSLGLTFYKNNIKNYLEKIVSDLQKIVKVNKFYNNFLPRLTFTNKINQISKNGNNDDNINNKEIKHNNNNNNINLKIDNNYNLEKFFKDLKEQTKEKTKSKKNEKKERSKINEIKTEKSKVNNDNNPPKSNLNNIFLDARVSKEDNKEVNDRKSPEAKVDEINISNSSSGGGSNDTDINEILNVLNEYEEKMNVECKEKIKDDNENIPVRNTVDMNKCNRNYVLNCPVDKDDVGKNAVIDKLLLDIKNDNKIKKSEEKKFSYTIEDVKGDGNCALSAILKALEIKDKLIDDNNFILNFRKISCEFLLNYEDEKKIGVDLNNFIEGKNFFERKNNLANKMRKNYCYINDIMLQLIAEMLNIVIAVETVYYEEKNKYNYINYEYFGDKNDACIEAIICLRLNKYTNEAMNHFQAKLFDYENANNVKGRKKVRERLTYAIQQYENNNFEEVNKFLRVGLYNMGSILHKFNVKDSESNNDCVYAALCICFEIEASQATEMRKLVAKIYQENNRKEEAEEILYKERSGNNEDINLICNKYKFKVKVYIKKAESYVAEEIYGENGPIIYLLLEKSKDEQNINHVSALIPHKKELYENFNEFKKIRDIIYEEIKLLFNVEKENICPINLMKVEEIKIKKSKSLKNLIVKNKNKEEIDVDNETEEKKKRKVLNIEVTKKMFDFIGENYIICSGTKEGNTFKKKIQGIKNKTEKCDENVVEIVKNFWKRNIVENEIKEYLQNSKNHRGENMNMKDKNYRNLYFKEKFRASDVYSKLFITNDVGRRIGPCICTGCSKIIDKNPMLRIINDFICLRDHCLSQHKDEQGFGYIPKGSIVNLDFDKKLYKIGFISHGSGKKFYLVKKEIVEKFNWEAAGKEIEKEKDINELKITGWNMMKAAAEDNVTFINKFLVEDNTDILMLNEAGKLNNNRLNKDYKIYGKDKYVRTLINKKYDSTICFPELNDECCLICRITLETGSFIAFNYYLRPDDKKHIRIGDLKNKLRDLIAKTKNNKIVAYGDLNINKDDIMKYIGYDLKRIGGKIIFSNLECSFTRIRNVGDTIQTSYIDYFINFGINETKFNIQKIGRSDHLAISLNIDAKSIDTTICRKKELYYNYKKINENYEETSKKFLEAISNKGKVANIIKLIDELRNANKPRVRKVKNVFNLNEKLKKFIDDKNILKSNDKNLYKELNKLARNIRKDEYCSFLLGLEKLKAKKFIKEFFVKMKFYTNINKKTDIIKNLIINENQNSGDINYTTDINVINKKINQKFKNLLQDDGYKRIYLPSVKEQEDLFSFTNYEIEKCIKDSNLNKATSWDMIPGKVFKSFISDKGKESAECIRNLNNLRVFMNDLANNYIYFPEEIATARLVCINKDASKLGDVNNIRGIAVNSIIIKLLERLLLKDLKKEINQKQLISKEQIGFMEGLGCEVNLLRLRQRCNDVKKINKGFIKAVIFIDLKNAYDTVAHNILFNKLENMNIRPRLLRILKALYSSARISVDINDSRINVNRGVLQGSILSPFLFNLYINDLIKEIKKVAFEVLAYADDIAIICSCEKEINLAIDAVERWTEKNKLILNKKKSAIMYLFNSEIKWKKYLGFPVVKQYRYLGILINHWLNPIGGLKETSKKLEVYIRRNKWLLKRYFSIKTLIQLCEYFQKSRITYGAAVFLQLNTIVNFIDETCFRFMRNIIGLGKGTPKSRFMLAIANGSFRNTMMIRLIKVFKKYRMHFNEHPTLYNDIINEFENWYGNIDENASINVIKKNTIDKSLKEMAEKNDIKISEDFRKTVKKYWYKGSAEEERCFIRYICETGWTNNHKKCYRCGSEEGYTKEHVLNKCPIFEKWRNRTIKKIGCSNIKKWLDINIFRPKYSKMNDYKIKLIRSILNDFYKDKKKYMRAHKIRHAKIRYKRSKKGGKLNLFDA